MVYLVPVCWLVGLAFSCIGVAVGSDGNRIHYVVTEFGVIVLHLFCLGQLVLFTLSNKLFFHYNRQRYCAPSVSLVVSFFASGAALATNITIGVGAGVAGALYIPMLVTQVAVQFGYGFYVYRKRKNNEERQGLDVSTVGSMNSEALLRSTITIAAENPDLAVKIAKLAVKK